MLVKSASIVGGYPLKVFSQRFHHTISVRGRVVGAVPEVRASIIDASSRFTSVAASVIRRYLYEIADLLSKRKRLNAQIAEACDRVRGKEQADHHTDIELLRYIKAADGCYGMEWGGFLQITLSENRPKTAPMKVPANSDAKIKLFYYWKFRGLVKVGFGRVECMFYGIRKD